MATSITDRLDGVPLRNAKAGLDVGETPRQNPTPAGALVDLARKRCGLEVKQMAGVMGVSESFLLRGFKDQEHISYQRLRKLSAAFHRELLAVEASRIEGIEVDTIVRITRTA